MIREKLIDKGIGDNKKFRWRSYSFLAGMTYMLNAVALPLHGMVMRKRRRRLEERFGSSENSVLESD